MVILFFRVVLPKKSGDGFPGLDLNSGWNCAPMKNLWEDSSMICIQGAPFIRWWRIFCVELLGTNCKSTVSKEKIPSRPPCVFHFHPCPQIEARPSQSLGPYQGSPEKQNTFHRYTKEQWHIWFNMAIRQFSKTTSYLWRCLSSTEVALPYLW